MTEQPAVAEAVAQQAQVEALARKPRAPGTVAAGVRKRCRFGEAQQSFPQSFKKNTAATTAA